jgi:hypothetical protein
MPVAVPACRRAASARFSAGCNGRCRWRVTTVVVVLGVCAVGEDGELPAELTKHDPRLVEAVCNDVSLPDPSTATQLAPCMCLAEGV